MKAKTIAQYMILRWMECNNLYLPAFKTEIIDANTIKITDADKKSALLTYLDGYVSMEGCG